MFSKRQLVLTIVNTKQTLVKIYLELDVQFENCLPTKRNVL